MVWVSSVSSRYCVLLIDGCDKAIQFADVVRVTRNKGRRPDGSGWSHGWDCAVAVPVASGTAVASTEGTTGWPGRALWGWLRLLWFGLVPGCTPEQQGSKAGRAGEGCRRQDRRDLYMARGYDLRPQTGPQMSTDKVRCG